MELQTEGNPEKRMNENDEIAGIYLPKREILSSSNAGTWPRAVTLSGPCIREIQNYI